MGIVSGFTRSTGKVQHTSAQMTCMHVYMYTYPPTLSSIPLQYSYLGIVFRSLSELPFHRKGKSRKASVFSSET